MRYGNIPPIIVVENYCCSIAERRDFGSAVGDLLRMTTLSDLSWDLVAEILSRVPITSLRSVRLTCREWNSLSKNRVFGKAAARNQFLGFMVMDSRVCSLKFDLQGIRDYNDLVDPPSINPVSMLNEVEIFNAFHCDGLLLCINKDNSRLLVWNPYLGQTRWIQPSNDFNRYDRFALGYDNNRNHKILRIFDIYDQSRNNLVSGFEIYGFSSDSWRVLDVTSAWKIPSYQRGVAFKGYAYFYAQEKIIVEGEEGTEYFLLYFDFTSERLGPRLSLPFHSFDEEIVTLFCVRDERLAVLRQHLDWEACMVMEIWVTNKIDPSAVSWTKFMELEMSLLDLPVDPFAGGFFIDEEKEVAVVFDLDNNELEPTESCRHYQTAHIIGEDGYFKSVNIGKAPNQGKPDIYDIFGDIPLPLFSYVPSLVQIIN